MQVYLKWVQPARFSRLSSEFLAAVETRQGPASDYSPKACCRRAFVRSIAAQSGNWLQVESIHGFP